MLRPHSCLNIPENVASKLMRANITTKDLITQNLEKLASRTTIPTKDLLSIRDNLIERQSSSINKANDVYEDMLQNFGVFSTGIEKLDFILDGGIIYGEIVELFGPSAVGKTQLCFQFSALITSTTKNAVLFIDTCGSFSARRMRQIMKENGSTDQMCLNALSRISYQSCFDIYELIRILDKAIQDNKEKNEEARRVKLIVIDSISSLLIPTLGNTYLNGFSVINRISNKLKMLSTSYFKTIVTTNEEVQWGNEVPKPALGQYWASVPHIRLWITKDDDDDQTESDEPKCRIQIYKSTRSETKRSVSVKLSTVGVQG